MTKDSACSIFLALVCTNLTIFIFASTVQVLFDNRNFYFNFVLSCIGYINDMFHKLEQLFYA